MGYLRTMGPGGAGYTTKVYGNANINGNQGGGNKKQGLPPSMGISRPYGVYKTRAGGNLPNRDIVYYGNQVGNIGSNKSSQFAPGAGSSPRPSATLYGKKIISVSPPPPSISPDVPGSGSVVIDIDDVPGVGPLGGTSSDDYIEISPETKDPELITGVFGGGYLRLSGGDSTSATYTEEPVPSDKPRGYTLDIERTIENLVSRDMKVIVIDIDIYPGIFADYKSGIHWNRFIDLARHVRDSHDCGIDIWVALKSRSLMKVDDVDSTRDYKNRWGITGRTAAPNATVSWMQALDEIGDVKHCVGDYADLLSSSHGTLDCIRGVVWDDFSVDYAKWNIYTKSKYHTSDQIHEIYKKAVKRDLKIGGVWYFEKFARAYAKDGIELALSGPNPYATGLGAGETAGRMPLEGLSATYYIDTSRFGSLGPKRDLRFKYFYRTGTNWDTPKGSGTPKLQMRCRFNDIDIHTEKIDLSDRCDPATYSCEVPIVFPDESRSGGDCNHVCVVSDEPVEKHYIPDSALSLSDPFQKLTFILEPNPGVSWLSSGPIFDGDTGLSVWDIEIHGSDTSLGKIEFDEVIEIHPSAPVTAVASPFPTRLQFNKESTLDNAFVLGRTEQYNISEYLTPFIGFPKWCKFLYDYRLNSINKSIAKNCDLDYYAWVRTRSRNYTYDAEKIKLQLDSATNYGGAKALLSYNEPMFVTDIDTTTTITTYRGIFSEKDSRKDRFNKVLWWTPYHGAFDGFFKQFTTQEEYEPGTEFRMNLLFEGNLVTWDRNAFDFKITDEYDDGFEVSYKLDETDETGGKEEKFMDGIIQSSWPVGSARSPDGVEWGHPDWLTTDKASTDESWRKSVLCFNVDELAAPAAAAAPRKVKLRLEIRREGQGIGATANFGAWFTLQKKAPADPEWENVTDFDFEAGYDPSYKGIYEEVSDYLKTLI